MKQSTNLIHINRKTVIGLIVVILIFAIATPVLADYLGPNRTVTEASSTCKVVLYECQYVASKDVWKYRKAGDWSCSNEGKPWKAYSSSPSSQGCFSGTAGDTYWSKEEVLQEVTITHPSATIINSLQNCNLNNGWCNTTPELALSGTEPLSGYNILAIEGSLNGQTFACSGENCSISLNEGNNDFTFWALSSWGDSSEMGTFSSKVDTVPPTLGLDISASNGTNGWYVSQTSVTATGSDSTSGLSSVLLSVNNGPWESSAILNEGAYNVNVQAEDNAGNISNTSSTISVDTTTPSIDLSLKGTAGKNGWYISNIEIAASAIDATSGVGLLEVSSDGGAYANYTTPIVFSDGIHQVQFKATDNAGIITETSSQEFLIDTMAPVVDLPASWEINETIIYKVQDDGSGLAELRVVIEDEDEKYAKVVWKNIISGAKYTGEINWDGKFADNTVAPPGEYHVWIKTSDMAGNERYMLGIVTVPSPLSLFDFTPVETSPASTPKPPKELFDEDIIPLENTSPLIINFGGSTSQVEDLETTSFSVTPNVPSPSTTANSNLLWGAVAAAVVGSATAYALEEKRKREEEEARQRAQVKAEVDATNAALHASQQAQWEAQKIQNWLDGQDILNAHIKAAKEQGATDKQISDLKEMSAQQGLGTAIGEASKLNQNLQTKAILDARLEMKMSRYQVEDEIAWQEAEQIKTQKAQETQKALDDYRAGEHAEYVAPPEKSWWEKTINVIDKHQPLAAVALGVAIGIGAVAIIVTGGIATPLVVGGALLLAGALTAGGTAALNAHYDRPLTENMFKNVGYSVVSALATIVIGMVVTGSITSGSVQQLIYRGGNSITRYCVKYPSVCGRVTAGVELWDKVEDIGLQAKLAIQTANGDPRASETALELQLERLDNVPGNTTFREIYETAIEFFGKKGDEAVQIASTLARLGNDVQIDSDGLIKVGSDVVPEVFEEVVDELKKIPGRNVWASRSTIYINSPTQNSMEAVSQLKTAVANGADEATVNRLIEQVAAATTHGSGDRLVLGAWQEGSGYIGDAVESGGVFFDTGDETWEVLKSLKEIDVEPWRINEAFLRQQLENGVERIDFVGIDILDVINSTDINVRNSYRAKEIRWLLENAKDFGYINVGNSWVLP